MFSQRWKLQFINQRYKLCKWFNPPRPPPSRRAVIPDLLICVLILLIKSPPGSLLTMLSRIILVGKDFKGISWKIKIPYVTIWNLQ